MEQREYSVPLTTSERRMIAAALEEVGRAREATVQRAIQVGRPRAAAKVDARAVELLELAAHVSPDTGAKGGDVFAMTLAGEASDSWAMLLANVQSGYVVRLALESGLTKDVEVQRCDGETMTVRQYSDELSGPVGQAEEVEVASIVGLHVY